VVALQRKLKERSRELEDSVIELAEEKERSRELEQKIEELQAKQTH